MIDHPDRPFNIVKKSDGRPAVEIDNEGKKQQFVSAVTIWMATRTTR